MVGHQVRGELDFPDDLAELRRLRIDVDDAERLEPIFSPHRLRKSLEGIGGLALVKDQGEDFAARSRCGQNPGRRDQCRCAPS